MNNKGQSLVLFILIIPILLGVMVLVTDVGNAIHEKNKINSIIEMVIEYGLEENSSEEEINKLLEYNLKNNNNTVKIEDNTINITVSSYKKGVISNIISFKGFKIVSEYIGYIKDDKKVIEKVR
jgi:Flp pilus assembly protein TadG